MSPHRMVGGVGLILISAGIASVTSPRIHPPAFNTQSMVTGIGVAQGISGQTVAESSGTNESDSAYRGFSLATQPLPSFRITDLSAALRMDERFEITALSQNGAVLGTIIPLPAKTASPQKKRAAPRTYAARWEKGVLCRFPIPPDAHRVVAGDINDNGEVGAVSIRYRRGKPSFNRVLLYRHDTTYEDFGTLDSRYEHSDTNDSSKMRGVSENLICLNNQRTILALVGSKSWFRRSDGTLGPVGNGIAFDLNNSGTAVGYAGAFSSGAAMWDNASSPGRSSITPLLPLQKAAQQKETQSRWRGSADCINDKGDIVISVPIDSANGLRRLGRTAYYLVRNGKLQFIGQMRGYQRSRTRINDSGDVIGFVDTDQKNLLIAPILYRDGKMYDLTDAAQNPAWKIVGTIDINNKREILAYATRNNQEDKLIPVLLSPIVRGPDKTPHEQ